MAPSNERKERRRARSARNDQDEEEERRAKRQKTLTDDLVCPITLELPFDPVMAEDGRVYERTAIEKHMEGKSAAALTSPMTGRPMGNRLLPAVQHKNHIQSMIETGVITGDLVENWNKRAKKKKDMDDLIAKAENGDAQAMIDLGQNYCQGRNGFSKDAILAYTWNKKAHDVGKVEGTAFLAYALLDGVGIATCHSKGVMFASIAAAQGSDYAAYRLGLALADGLYRLPVDKPEAIKWLRKSVSGECTVKQMDEAKKKNAREKLTELETA